MQVTCSKDAVVGKDPASVENKSSAVFWNENRTRLYKIYAAIRVKDTNEDYISAETYSQLRSLK